MTFQGEPLVCPRSTIQNRTLSGALKKGVTHSFLLFFVLIATSDRKRVNAFGVLERVLTCSRASYHRSRSQKLKFFFFESVSLGILLIFAASFLNLRFSGIQNASIIHQQVYIHTSI